MLNFECDLFISVKMMKSSNRLSILQFLVKFSVYFTIFIYSNWYRASGIKSPAKFQTRGNYYHTPNVACMIDNYIVCTVFFIIIAFYLPIDYLSFDNQLVVELWMMIILLRQSFYYWMATIWHYIFANSVPQWWFEFVDQLSWLFTKRFRNVYFICRK